MSNLGKIQPMVPEKSMSPTFTVGGWVAEAMRLGCGGYVVSNYSQNNATFVAHLASQDFSDFQLG